MNKLKITIQNLDGEELGTFFAEDKKSIVDLASENGIKIPTSCRHGACGRCKCSVVQGGEFIDGEKLSKPMGEVAMDAEGNPTSVFTCIAGIQESQIDNPNAQVVLKLKTSV